MATDSGIQKPVGMVLGASPEDQPRVTLMNGRELEAVDMTSFRKSPGGFLENAFHGRTFAITKKGRVLCVIEPPPTRKATKEELQAILNGETDTAALREH